MSEAKRLPILYVEAETCGEAWEKAVKAVWLKGIDIEHHYKDEDEESKWSKEATVTINVTNPLKEPRFSRRDFISVAMFMTGKEKKKPYREKEYVREVLDGDIDFRVEEGTEAYTYHERLWRWGLKQPVHEEMLNKRGVTMELLDVREYSNHEQITKKMLGVLQPQTINQIEMLIQKARDESISRKLQVTTWEPHKDLLISGAPCLQRIWIRIIKKKYMVMETHWRSRDLFQAWGANNLAMVELGKLIADELNLEFTQLVDISNSLHIYAKSYDKVKHYFETIKQRAKKVFLTPLLSAMEGKG